MDAGNTAILVLLASFFAMILLRFPIAYAVALSSGTAALHLAVKLCGEKLYGQPKVGHGTLEGKKVITV